MNRTSGQLVLTLPSVKDNFSASAPLLPGMTSENHASNNVQGSNHNNN